MVDPPSQLDVADVLCWAVSTRGGFYVQVGSQPPNIVVAMAVARYSNEKTVYLFKCDRDWEVVGDFVCDSVVEAQKLAESHANGEPLEWKFPDAGRRQT